MERFGAFLLGIWEFRLSVTTWVPDDLADSYDRGREIAHRVTRRKFETWS